MALDVCRASKLWDTWNIRGLIFLSLCLQVFLIFAAMLRKTKGRNWFFRWPFWLVYLSADWVATYTVGLIFSSNSCVSSSSTHGPPSDILMFWAPFLLLHLGGPDTITSYALEDNALWKRHLFQLVLQAGNTAYIIVKPSSKGKFLHPAILVLFAGVIKYAERTIAFYRASLDHFGSNWAHDSSTTKNGLPIPKQFVDIKRKEFGSSVLGCTVQLFGILKRVLVGPLLDGKDKRKIKDAFDKIRNRHDDVFRLMEIELSLLYEVLHTKLPVIASRTGLYFRMANLGCVIGALVFFTLTKGHHQLHKLDILLTYALLLGAIALDFTSIWLHVKYSDWFAISRFRFHDVPRVINRRRWSNTVSQSNLITYYVKEYPVFFKKMTGFLYLRVFFQALKDFRCESSEAFGEGETWSFIVEEAEKFGIDDSQSIRDYWMLNKGNILLGSSRVKFFKGLDFTRSLLLFHVVSELCFQDDNSSNSREDTINERRNYKAICKFFSDYMFHLAVTQSTLMSAVLDNWESEFEDLLYEIKNTCRQRLNDPIYSSDESGVCLNILNGKITTTKLLPAVELAKEFMKNASDVPWEVMSRIWVQFMCYAAINCKAEVHARQPTQGGELLTFVWLLMNHLEIVYRPYTTISI